MNLQAIAAYVVTAILFGALDAIWLTKVGPKLYRPEIGELLMDGWRPAPALIFYALYMLGIQIFAVQPALAAGKWQVAAQYGALFGFFCYMTYDLTNQATLRVWSTKITLADIAWGTFATGVAAGAAAWIILTLLPRSA